MGIVYHIYYGIKMYTIGYTTLLEAQQALDEILTYCEQQNFNIDKDKYRIVEFRKVEEHANS